MLLISSSENQRQTNMMPGQLEQSAENDCNGKSV